MNYALILSGGSGTRLWPLSRKSRPKHLIPISGSSPLLEQTLDRLEPLVPPNLRYLITIPEQAPIVRDIARGRAAGIIIEPFGRNNALPLALSTRFLLGRDPEAKIVFLPADHSILHPDILRGALTKAFEVASAGYIVTLGIPTKFPEPNYGHVQRGDPVPGFEKGDFPAFKVGKFHEKPPFETAEKYAIDDDWFWNSGIFIFSAARMYEAFKACCPDLYELAEKLARELASYNPTVSNPVIDWSANESISEAYKNLPDRFRTSIDFAVMEHAENVVTIPVDMGWSDLGGFDALALLIDPDENGNRIGHRADGEDALVLTPGSKNISIFPGKRAVVCLDCEDLIVVDTPDALLVLPSKSSRRVGDVVAQIKAKGWLGLL